MTNWPELNRLVWLQLPCCKDEHPTRVEDFDEDDLVVSAPIRPHIEPVAPVRPNLVFNLGWAVGRGAVEQPVTLTSHRETPLLLWQLRRAGKATEVQRRNYVRLDVAFNVELQLLESGAPNIAHVIDVSEGGLRARVDRWALDPHGRTFDVKLSLGDKTYRLDAQIAWWGSSLDDTGLRTIGVKFVEVEPRVGDEIRTYIFSTQIERRRRSME